MKRILVPCDFSKESIEAYKFAIDLASMTKGTILLLHILAIPGLYITGFSEEPVGFSSDYLSGAQDEIKKELHRMKNLVPAKSIPVTTEVIYGELISAIKITIETHDIDLVVMGTSGASGFKEILVGSNTEKLVRFSPVPVFVVPNAVALNTIKNILLPSTLGLNQHEFVLKLKELQQLFNATLHILFVNTPVNFRSDIEAKESLEEFSRHYKLTNFKLHFRNNANQDEGILEFAYTEKMDVIAMATHARKGLAHLFNTSVTESVVNHTLVPLWTYRLKA